MSDVNLRIEEITAHIDKVVEDFEASLLVALSHHLFPCPATVSLLCQQRAVLVLSSTYNLCQSSLCPDIMVRL